MKKQIKQLVQGEEFESPNGRQRWIAINVDIDPRDNSKKILMALVVKPLDEHNGPMIFKFPFDQETEFNSTGRVLDFKELGIILNSQEEDWIWV